MKKFCETDTSLSELRSALKTISKKKSDNAVGIIFGIACIIALTAAIIFISLKLKSNKDFDFDDDFDDDDFDDDFDYESEEDYSDDDFEDDTNFDENGCRFASEKDFEK